MSTKEKSPNLRWLIFIVIVIAAGFSLWLRYRARPACSEYRKYTAQQRIVMLEEDQFRMITHWNGLSVQAGIRARKCRKSGQNSGLNTANSPCALTTRLNKPSGKTASLTQALF